MTNKIDVLEIFDGKATLYQDKNDFAFRSQFRRLTFGYSMYARKRISLLSRLRLIWVAYFTNLGGNFRHLAYVELYCERRTKNCLRILKRRKIIDWDDPRYMDMVGSVVIEKALLDRHEEATGHKFIN